MKTASEPPTARAPEWPGPLYLDASALVKIYLPEAGSEELDSALVGRCDLMVSDLAITEITSAIVRRRREGSVAAPLAARLHRALLHDLDSGIYQRLDLLPVSHRLAERLLFALESVSLRAADALHLALASEAGAASIVTYDVRLSHAALTIGLGAVPARS